MMHQNSNNNAVSNAGTMLGLFSTTSTPGHLMPAPQTHLPLVQHPTFLIPAPQITQPPATPISHLSLAEMESIISPLTRRRSDGFAKEEVKLMIREIERRRNILLSVSPSYNKLKRQAWEEVANCMAEKFPHENRRTGDQVKKKWENIVSKTKKKIRDGHVTAELDWNETNTLVMQFLASATQEMRVRQQSTIYGCPAPPALTDQSQAYTSPLGYATANCTVSSTAVFPSTSLTSHMPGVSMASFPELKTSHLRQQQHQHQPDHRDEKPITSQQEAACKPEETNGNRNVDTAIETAVESISTGNTDDIDEDNDESDADNDTSNVDLTRMPGLDVSTNYGLLPPGSNELLLLNSLNLPTHRPIIDELIRQSREEHHLRMEILQLQKRVWQTKVESLERKDVFPNNETSGNGNPSTDIS